MEDLFKAIKDTVQAGIDGDNAKLGTSIVSIVENGAVYFLNYLDSNLNILNINYKGEILNDKISRSNRKTVEAAKSGNDAELGSSIVDIVSSGVGLLGKLFGF